MERAAAPLAEGSPDRASSTEPAEGTRRRPPRRRVLAAVAVLALLVAGLVVWQYRSTGPAPLTRADVDKAVATGIAKALQQQRNAPPDAAAAFRAIQPSLVTITTEPAAGTTAASPSPGGVEKVGLDAGVVINADGSVLTALHVVSGNNKITVRFADGTKGTAKIAKQTPASDIAVLSVEQLPSVIVPAVMGGGVQVGDAVFPVGNPLGLVDSLSAGVVSATGRSIKAPDGRALTGLIQFDAAVNPGNSGGPLLNRDGQVVGIVTGLANPSQQPYFVGIGFAVPIATAGGAAGGPAQ